jgi:putative transposase
VLAAFLGVVIPLLENGRRLAEIELAFHTRTTRPNEMWQTEFTYFKIIGSGWICLSTLLDDFLRYIIVWKLCTNMQTEDVNDTLDLALKTSGCNHATVQYHQGCSVTATQATSLANWLNLIEARKLGHVRGAPMHPQTQAKIARWHQTLKDRTLLGKYFLPGDLDVQIEAFVEHYNYQRYRESPSHHQAA